MKHNFVIATLLTALLSATSATQAVGIDARPGLWELVDTTGASKQPDMECITADELGDSAQLIAKARKSHGTGCTLSNVKETSRLVSYEVACDSSAGKGKGQYKAQFESATAMQMSMKYDGSMTLAGGKTMPMQLDIQRRGRWLSADCGEHADEDVPEDEDAADEEG